jgi:hypothetical protein
MASTAFERNDASASGALIPTFSDTVNFAGGPSSYILLSGAGAVKVTMADNTDIVLTGLAVGTLHPIRVKRIWATGTVPAAGSITVFL